MHAHKSLYILSRLNHNHHPQNAQPITHLFHISLSLLLPFLRHARHIRNTFVHTRRNDASSNWILPAIVLSVDRRSSRLSRYMLPHPHASLVDIDTDEYNSPHKHTRTSTTTRCLLMSRRWWSEENVCKHWWICELSHKFHICIKVNTLRVHFIHFSMMESRKSAVQPRRPFIFDHKCASYVLCIVCCVYHIFARRTNTYTVQTTTLHKE